MTLQKALSQNANFNGYQLHRNFRITLSKPSRPRRDAQPRSPVQACGSALTRQLLHQWRCKRQVIPALSGSPVQLAHSFRSSGDSSDSLSAPVTWPCIISTTPTSSRPCKLLDETVLAIDHRPHLSAALLPRKGGQIPSTTLQP